MAIQLFGIDTRGKQVYECKIHKSFTEAKMASDSILENMSHVEMVVAVENVPNMTQLENESYHISYNSRFLFIDKRKS